MQMRLALATSTALAASLTLALAAAPVGVAQHAMVGPDEPGTPLVLVVQVVDATTGAPVPHADVLLYQADDAGAYRPSDPADESTARLRAEGRADELGRFAVRTVLPGEYPDQPPGNRHVHVEHVRAPGYAPAGGVVLFEQNVNDTVRAWARATGFGRIVALAWVDDGWRGEVTIELHRHP